MPRLRAGLGALAMLVMLSGLPVGACAEPASPPSAVSQQSLLFSGAELWRTGGLLYGGFVWSPGGLSADGFAMKVSSGTGRYHYRAGARTIKGRQVFSAAMPGWRFKQPGFEASLFAGMDLRGHRFDPADRENSLHGTHLGLKLVGEFWCEPAAATMVQSWTTWSSIDTNYATRSAFGWRLFERLYLGPEVQAFTNGRYRQFRFGLHVTAWRTGHVEWSAGLGYARDNTKTSGTYLRLGLQIRR